MEVGAVEEEAAEEEAVEGAVVSAHRFLRNQPLEELVYSMALMN